MLAALALTMVGRSRPHLTGYLLGIAAGVTWATNAVGGGTVVLGLVVDLVAVAFGWAHRNALAGVLIVGFVPAVVVMVIGLAVPRATG